MQIAYIRNLTVFQSVNGIKGVLILRDMYIWVHSACLLGTIELIFLGEVVMTSEDNPALNFEDQV